MKKLLLLLCLLGLAWPAAWAAEPGAGPIMALGKAPAGAVESTAREAAVADALKSAVGRAALEMADPAALKGRMEVLERQVLANAARFVTTYSLQSSTKSGDTLNVLVAVTLDRAALEKAIAEAGLRAAPTPAASGPATLTLVSEETAPNRPATFWWSEIPGLEAAPAPVAKALGAKGYKIIDIKPLLGKVPLEFRQALLNEDQALELGRKAGASLVILGRVRTYPLVTTAGENPPPVAQLQALALPEGQALATVEEAGPAFSATPGPEGAEKVATAVEGAARTLLAEAAAAPRQAPAPAQTALEMEVSGLRSLNDLTRLEEALGGLSGLVTEFSRQSLGGGKATYRLRLNGEPSRLAEELASQNLGGLAPSGSQPAPDRLTVVLTPKP